MSLEERRLPPDDAEPDPPEFVEHLDEQHTIPLRTPARIGWAEAHSHRDRPHLRRDPLRVYATRAVILDSVAVLVAGIVGFILRWAIPYSIELNNLTYVSLVVVVVASWMIILILRGAYDTRILGVGSEEFKRVVAATRSGVRCRRRGRVRPQARPLARLRPHHVRRRTDPPAVRPMEPARLAAARAPLRALPAPHGRHRRRADEDRDRRHARPRSGRRASPSSTWSTSPRPMSTPPPWTAGSTRS